MLEDVGSSQTDSRWTDRGVLSAPHGRREWCGTQPFDQRVAYGTLIFSVAAGMNDVIRARGQIRAIRADEKRPGHCIVVEALSNGSPRRGAKLPTSGSNKSSKRCRTGL